MIFVKVAELTFPGFQREETTFLLVRVCVCVQVHSSCKEQTGKVCPLGQCRVSIIPPTALNSIDSDGENLAARASAALRCASFLSPPLQ